MVARMLWPPPMRWCMRPEHRRSSHGLRELYWVDEITSICAWDWLSNIVPVDLLEDGRLL